MTDFKSFTIGFLVAVIIIFSLGFTDVKAGSVSWKPLYVKVVK
jgi:hypothetical protein|tara:strand:- start:22 stop:150 length:129 start_codon:yes stop_codon:yes gene_type:complete